MEWQQHEFCISTDPQRLDIAFIYTVSSASLTSQKYSGGGTTFLSTDHWFWCFPATTTGRIAWRYYFDKAWPMYLLIKLSVVMD